MDYGGYETMLYPRTTKGGKLVAEEQMIGVREHFTQTHRILFLTGQVTGETESHNLLMAMDTLSHDPIKVVITSSGGSLDAAFLLYDTMKIIEAPIETLGRYCASAAAIFLAAGDRRYILPHAKVLLHMPRHYLSPGAGLLDTDLEVAHQEAVKYKKRLVEVLIECGAKRSEKQILADIENKDFWLDAQEVIDYGLADEIMSAKTWREWIDAK